MPGDQGRFCGSAVVVWLMCRSAPIANAAEPAIWGSCRGVREPSRPSAMLADVTVPAFGGFPTGHAGGVFEFDYKLTGSGWSEARIADDDSHAIVTASYLSDALRSLVDAVALVVEGQAEARCSWDEEPGEYRWILRRAAGGLRVEILAFDHLWGDEPDEAGREVFSTIQDPMRVARVVLSAAQRVLDDLGAAEYERQWVEHPFPAEALERLRAAIQSARGGTT